MTKRALEDYNLNLLPKGSLILSTRAPVGYVAVLKEEATFNQGCKGLVPKNRSKIIPEFYAYYFKFKRQYLESLSGGSTFKELAKAMLEHFLIPLPPLPEQKKIAEILRTVDEAIEKTDEAIEKTERLKKGLMGRLLTKGIGHERFKKTELGEIPEEWRVVRLGEIADLKSGGTPSRKKPEYWENGTIPWVKSGELNDGIIVETEEKITEKAVRESSAKIFPEGTLLFALYGKGTVGKTAILGIDAATNQAVCGIFPKNNAFFPRFMQYYLIHRREPILTQYVNPSSDVGRTNIYISSLALLKIPLPLLSEQKQIAEILSTVDRKLELLRKRREKLEKVKRGLMKDLLTGRRRISITIKKYK
ncbi:hypothetical protein A3L01_04530 [Thermococcus barossii]|uniref:Type I restriction modification DNA specificity domain-containing protein n=1 Tax=Thermococcus barossii TaxID=54077 RepID=A0A2Z2MIP4_9EURY|nr:hypothetical protein A3L01_04530 [Thermococcus barossii]